MELGYKRINYSFLGDKRERKIFIKINLNRKEHMNSKNTKNRKEKYDRFEEESKNYHLCSADRDGYNDFIFWNSKGLCSNYESSYVE